MVPRGKFVLTFRYRNIHGRIKDKFAGGTVPHIPWIRCRSTDSQPRIYIEMHEYTSLLKFRLSRAITRV